ncbi:hypothetical protein ACF061_07200 [Streptomyces sp. NPDC015220]|uniref:hypothetical protein n=1 Tax=Streptomyces sp. NPDC015220 TaxID=3364947 RepID=UPI0036FC6739
MARHGSFPQSTARRVLVAVATAGAALGAGATTAVAEAAPAGNQTHETVTPGEFSPGAATRTLTGTVGHATGPVTGLKPNPLAGTGVDPLDNGVGTQVADFRPVSSKAITAPVAEAPSVGAMPVVGQAAGALR